MHVLCSFGKSPPASDISTECIQEILFAVEIYIQGLMSEYRSLRAVAGVQATQGAPHLMLAQAQSPVKFSIFLYHYLGWTVSEPAGAQEQQLQHSLSAAACHAFSPT